MHRTLISSFFQLSLYGEYEKNINSRLSAEQGLDYLNKILNVSKIQGETNRFVRNTTSKGP